MGVKGVKQRGKRRARAGCRKSLTTHYRGGFVRASVVEPPPAVPPCDTIRLTMVRGEEAVDVFMTPDEALVVADLLTRAVLYEGAVAGRWPER